MKEIKGMIWRLHALTPLLSALWDHHDSATHSDLYHRSGQKARSKSQYRESEIDNQEENLDSSGRKSWDQEYQKIKKMDFQRNDI